MQPVQERRSQATGRLQPQSVAPRRSVPHCLGPHPVFLVGCPGSGAVLMPDHRIPLPPARPTQRPPPTCLPHHTFMLIDGSTMQLSPRSVTKEKGCQPPPQQVAHPANRGPGSTVAANQLAKAFLLGGKKLVKFLLRVLQGQKQGDRK